MDRRVRKSKKALKNALYTLMKKKSISYITISELCELADVNRSTFYANYTNINELITDIHYDFFDDMFLSKNYLTSAKDFSQLKYEPIYNMISYVENNKDKINILFYNNENSLLEQNLLRFFMESCNINSVDYQISYPFIYHTMAFITLLHVWVKDNYPCNVEELTQIVIRHSTSISDIFKKPVN